MKAMKQQQKLLAAQQATAFNPMAQGMMGMENQVSTAPPLPPRRVATDRSALSTSATTLPTTGAARDCTTIESAAARQPATAARAVRGTCLGSAADQSALTQGCRSDSPKS